MEDDNRYSVALEYCGFKHQQYVARFCGQFISAHISKVDGHVACDKHHAKLTD